MDIQDLIDQLNDMVLLYNTKKIILTITDGDDEYRIKKITGINCGRYFQPYDNVAEVIINIKRKWGRKEWQDLAILQMKN